MLSHRRKALKRTLYDPRYYRGGRSFDVSGQISLAIMAIFFSPDGVNLFILDALGGTGTAYRYTLSKPWDILTASFEDSYNVGADTTPSGPTGMWLSDDGTQLFFAVQGPTDGVREYSLSPAWDLSTASFVSFNGGPNSQDTTMLGISFGDSGNIMYMTGAANDDIFQYSVSPAWDSSEATYASKSLDVGSISASGRGHSWRSDGLRFIYSAAGSNGVHQCVCTTAWDLATASISSGINKDFLSLVIGNSFLASWIGNGGRSLYYCSYQDGVNADVYQFDLF